MQALQEAVHAVFLDEDARFQYAQGHCREQKEVQIQFKLSRSASLCTPRDGMGDIGRG